MHTDYPLHNLFHLPLSEEAFQQYQDFNLTLNFHTTMNQKNGFIPRDLICSLLRGFTNILWVRQIHLVYRWLWKSACQNKRKIFFYLLLKDRLSTRKILRRKNMHLQDYSCVLCQLGIEENLTRLFLSCPVPIQCWSLLQLDIGSLTDPFAILPRFKPQLNVPFFMEIMVSLSQAIWIIHNYNIFYGRSVSVQRCKDIFKEEFA